MTNINNISVAMRLIYTLLSTEHDVCTDKISEHDLCT